MLAAAHNVAPGIQSSGLIGWLHLRSHAILWRPKQILSGLQRDDRNSCITKAADWAVRSWGTKERSPSLSPLLLLYFLLLQTSEHKNPSSDKFLLQPKYVIKAEKMRRKEKHTATWVSMWKIIQGQYNCLRSFQAVGLSHKWKHNNNVGASRASGGSRIHTLRLGFISSQHYFPG